MFIPRTLAQTESSGRGAWARAAIVGGFLAVALFAVLSVNVGSARLNLSEGDVAQADITAPFTRSFVSDSQTKAAQEAAENAVAPVYEQIAPRPTSAIDSWLPTTRSRAPSATCCS